MDVTGSHIILLSLKTSSYRQWAVQDKSLTDKPAFSHQMAWPKMCLKDAELDCIDKNLLSLDSFRLKAPEAIQLSLKTEGRGDLSTGAGMSLAFRQQMISNCNSNTFENSAFYIFQIFFIN